MQQPAANGLTNGTRKTTGISGMQDCFNPIAITGMACRFAGDASSRPARLWNLCAEGRDYWSSIHKERFYIGSPPHADKERSGRDHAIDGYFMNEDVAHFEAEFSAVATAESTPKLSYKEHH
ncbi:hypothetical protein LZ32DRAFT_664078 [Colletotrichum eremochloae]|nr:hypothetical protein LZ32DRAFT_664078 [Colletotrichum eremochloae]